MSAKTQDARVIIIGNTQVGKTALLNRFIDRQFTSTTSTTVTPVFSPTKIKTSTDHEVNLQLWDTAGQERYQAVGQIFYRNANFAVICFESSDINPKEAIEGWRKRILDVEPNCGIFLASTKYDLVDSAQQLEVIERGQNLKDSLGAIEFFATSAITGDGIDSLFVSVADEWEKVLQAQKTDPAPKTQELNSGEVKQEKKCC